MRKVFFVILMVMVAVSVFGINDRSIYGAAGGGTATFISMSEDENPRIFIFGSRERSTIYRQGFIIYVDEQMQPEGRIHFQWYVHRGEIVIDPYMLENIEDGEVVSTREGYNNPMKDPVSLFTYNGRTMLTIGDMNLLLMQ